MTELDAGTAAFYDGYAARLERGTESLRSAMLAAAVPVLPAGGWVLDVGAGAGRDVVALCDLGWQAVGVEPNAAMRATATRLHPALAGRLRDGALPALGRPFEDLCPQGFDAALCSAVLMHIAPDVLPLALEALVQTLRAPATGGAAPLLLISLPEMREDALQGHRDGDGRRFHNHAPARVEALLAAAGLVLHHWQASDAVLASSGTRWHTGIFAKPGPAVREP